MSEQETQPCDIDAEFKRISSVRMQMLEMHPFWGYLLLQIKLVAAPSMPVFAATDCIRHIWFNPARTRHLSIPQLGVVLAHEIGHQLFMSDRRRESRNMQRWNMATYHAINHIVAKIPNPSEWNSPLYNFKNVHLADDGLIKILMNPAYSGKIAEVIYEELCRKDFEAPTYVELKLPDNDNEGSESGRNSVDSPCEPRKNKSEDRKNRTMDHGENVDIHLPVSLDDSQREAIRERLRAAVEVWEESGQCGDMPGDELELLELLSKPKVPWRRVFHRFMDQALAKDDYSLVHPNRRYLTDDFVVPGRYGEKISTIVVALDSSGSMNIRQLKEVCGELKGFLPYVEDMTLIVADSEIQEVLAFEHIDKFFEKGEIIGRGGTDHRPVLNILRSNGLRLSYS